MKRSILAPSLLLTLALSAPGCRQTTAGLSQPVGSPDALEVAAQDLPIRQLTDLKDLYLQIDGGEKKRLELFNAAFYEKDPVRKKVLDAHRLELSAERDALGAEACALLLPLLPTDEEPWSDYRWDCKYTNALSIVLRTNRGAQVAALALHRDAEGKHVPSLRESPHAVHGLPAKTFGSKGANSAVWVHLGGEFWLQASMADATLRTSGAVDDLLDGIDFQRLSTVPWGDDES